MSGKKKMKRSALILILLGGLFICYCAAILVGGFGTWFFLVWGAMGVACILAGMILNREDWLEKIPRWVKRSIIGICCAGLLLFAIVEGMILSGFHATANPGADYVIILGAQWKASGPSEVLRRRLDRAILYLNENPDTKVIVSGGQGANEPISEAAGMKSYLLAAGIAESRILTEDQACNTKENMEYSGSLLDRKNDRVVLVTNNFHMFRAIRIAEKAGYSHVEGLPASSVIGFLPNNLLREFLSVLKNFVVGNL